MVGLQNRDALRGMDVNKVLNLQWVSIEPKLMLLENFHREANIKLDIGCEQVLQGLIIPPNFLWQFHKM